MPTSEVARLLQQISQEHQSAINGLAGLASGKARHDFITAKEAHVALLYEKLTTIVGKGEATEMVVAIYSQGETGNGADITLDQ